MKLSKQAILTAILLAVVLFVIGYFTWYKFFELVLPDIGNVNYITTSFTEAFRNSLLFGLTLALIPIATILIWKFAPVITPDKRIFTVCIIIFAMIVSVYGRRKMIVTEAKNLQTMTVLDYTNPSFPESRTIESRIPVSMLYFELFALGGLIAGSVFAFFAMRQKNIQTAVFMH